MRKRPYSESEAIKARIVALVMEAPRTSDEIASIIGMAGSGLGVYFSLLNKSGKVSRYEYAHDKFRYYPPGAAPEGSYRDEAKAPPPPAKPATVYAVPVRRLEYKSADGRVNRVTVVADPWGTAA